MLIKFLLNTRFKYSSITVQIKLRGKRGRDDMALVSRSNPDQIPMKIGHKGHVPVINWLNSGQIVVKYLLNCVLHV